MKPGLVLWSALSVFLLLLSVGCAQSPESVQSNSAAPMSPVAVPANIANPCGLVTTVTLFAGQTIDVGTVVVANDGERLCVTYNTTGPWYLTEDHLDIALTPEDIPQTNSGNPRPGQFTYSHILTAPARTDEYCFTLAQLGYAPGTMLCIAAHSKVQRMSNSTVVQKETAWGDGEPFPGANWATYIEHTLQNCGGGGGE